MFERTLLQFQCGHEQTKVLYFLLLATQNTRAAGYTLIGQKSLFQDTHGGIACLCHRTVVLPPLWVRGICYNRSPILYQRISVYIVPISHLTWNLVFEKPCLGDYTNVILFDSEKESSGEGLREGIKLLFDPMPFERTMMFKPKKHWHLTKFPASDIELAEMYAPKKCKNFQQIIIHATVSHNVLKRLKATISKENIAPRNSNPGNIERHFSQSRRVLRDPSLTLSFSIDKLKELFVDLG